MTTEHKSGQYDMIKRVEVKEDGRILIYYTFVEPKDEQSTDPSPPSGAVKEAVTAQTAEREQHK